MPTKEEPAAKPDAASSVTDDQDDRPGILEEAETLFDLPAFRALFDSFSATGTMEYLGLINDEKMAAVRAVFHHQGDFSLQQALEAVNAIEVSLHGVTGYLYRYTH